MSSEIDALLPAAARSLSDQAIADHYSLGSAARWVRANFVSSIDGAADMAGRSAGLGGDADHRVFDLLRRLCDVVLVGAGTVRTEGYGAMRLDDVAVAARIERGLAPQPAFAIVSARLDLDPSSTLFTEAPVAPLIITSASAARPAGVALSRAADVIVAGADSVDLPVALAALAERGLTRVHCEGGPSLFGSMLAADVIDELCLTVSPLLTAGSAGRITRGVIPATRGMSLAGVLQSDSTLLLRYLRDRS